MQEDQRTVRIRELNDRLRCHGLDGCIMVTRGVAALGEEAVKGILKAVASFTDFSDDNDPWGEHDCAVLTVGGTRIIWKIDYFDRELALGSPDPADPVLTVRLLTVMLADEY